MREFNIALRPQQQRPWSSAAKQTQVTCCNSVQGQETCPGPADFLDMSMTTSLGATKPWAQG